MKEPDSPKRQGGFGAGFLVGAIAGGVIAYVVGHEEARDAILGKVKNTGNFAAGVTTDVRQTAAELYTRGKTVVDNARSNITAAVDEGQETAERLRDDLSRESTDS
jgi:uncharacterized protein YcfJ